MNPRKLLLLILVLIITSCASDSEDAPVEEDSKIIVIPVEGFYISYASEISNNLSTSHNLNSKVTNSLPISELSINPSTNQIDASSIAQKAQELITLNNLDGTNKAFIVLTTYDINYLNSGLSFVFSTHYEQINLSVVSVARVDPQNYNLPANDGLKTDRLVKLINKSIGLNYYGYTTTSDINSVMYSPILSLDDLDAVGTWY